MDQEAEMGWEPPNMEIPQPFWAASPSTALPHGNRKKVLI